MWKRLNSNQMCEQFSYKEVFLIKRFLIERFYCIYIYIIYIPYAIHSMFSFIKNNLFKLIYIKKITLQLLTKNKLI